MVRRIAFFVPGMPGHLNPSLGLAIELSRRGNHVTYFVFSGYAQRISRMGIDIRPFGDPNSSVQGIPYSVDNWFEHARLLERSLENFKLIPHAIESYKNEEPDLIVYDRACCFARILAGCWRIPAVQISVGMAYPGGYLELENGIFCNPKPVVEFSKKLDQCFEVYGHNKKNNYRYLEDLNLYCYPAELQYLKEGFDDRVRFVGPCFSDFSTRITPRKQNDIPNVVVSFSTLTNTPAAYLEKIIHAFNCKEVRIILSIGKYVDENLFSNLPANFVIEKERTNFEILENADLMVCQAGMTTILESLYFGVPVIAISSGIYLDAYAFRINELGLGYMINKSEFSGNVLWDRAFSALNDDGMRNRVNELQRAIRRKDNRKIAADLVLSRF